MTKFNIEIEIDCETDIVESEIVEHITKALQPHPHSITKDFENVKVSVAPDLLKALELAKPFIRWDSNESDAGNDVLNKVDQAIQTARGE